MDKRYLLSKYAIIFYSFILAIMFVVWRLMPDTGTTIAYIIVLLSIISLTKFPPKLNMFLVLAFIVVVVLGIIALVYFPAALTKFTATKGFQQGRLVTFADPFKTVRSTGYQVVGSVIAIAKGSILGAGLGNGTQKLGWLPESESDFIFANVAEEIGLLGVLGIVIIFLILFIRLWKRIKLMADSFLQKLAFGLLCSIYANIFINLGGISGSIPLSGVPLPFFSAGVTNLMLTFVSIALLQNCINTDYAKIQGYEVYDNLLDAKKEKIRLKKELKSRSNKTIRLSKGEKIDTKKYKVKKRKVVVQKKKKKDKNEK